MPLIFGKTAAGAQVPVQVDAAGALALAAGSNLAARVDARSGDKIFSYLADLQAQYQNTNLPAGTTQAVVYTVPANTVAIITGLAVHKLSATMTVLGMDLNGFEIIQLVGADMPPNSSIRSAFGYWPLAAGKTVRVLVIGATAGDDVTANVFGFTMQA